MFADRPDRSVGRNAARSGKFVRESPAGGNRWGKDPPTLQAVTIRRAVSTDDPVLRQLAAASKGHWGYDQARLRRWASEIDLSELGTAGAEIYVAEKGGRLVGWAALRWREARCELDHLWIEPERIGEGIGSTLFRFAVARARELGAPRLEVESEPNAVGFYEKLGAARIGETTSSWGRQLPVLAVDLRD